MTRAFTLTLIACAATVLGLVALSGCGNDVPAGAVAKVGDSTISQDAFDKWMGIAVRGQSQSSPGGASAVPKPPDFEACVTAKKKTPVPKGQQKPSDEALKKQCKSEYDTLKREVMQFLIQGEWVQQEADKRGIEIKRSELQKSLEDQKKEVFRTDKQYQQFLIQGEWVQQEADKRGIEVKQSELKKSLDDQKKQVFPNDKQYQQFLKSSGMTEEDVLFRVKLNELQKKLTQDATKDAAKVSDEDISAYYAKNKDKFAQPERRDLRVVLTKTKAKAALAKKELESKAAFKNVVKKYSIDEASKSQGGMLRAVSEGQQEKPFNDAIFGAPKNKIEGPVKTQFGWYVFRVEKVTKASQQTLDESKETIRKLLVSQREQKALDAFVKSFRQDYKDETHCADDYRVVECDNAPKGESDTGPASGGNPGGQPQQPAPQQPAPNNQQP
jgi:foldase protein PrsA